MMGSRAQRPFQHRRGGGKRVGISRTKVLRYVDKTLDEERREKRNSTIEQLQHEQYIDKLNQHTLVRCNDGCDTLTVLSTRIRNKNVDLHGLELTLRQYND